MSGQLVKKLKPHVRETGDGATVVCLHSSVSSSKQWSALGELLSSTYRVVAPDLYGYGKSPEWCEKRTLTLADEVDSLSSMVDEIDGPFHLIGHSYGGAVAMSLTHRYLERIRSLTVFEPVLFSLLARDDRGTNALSEITLVSDNIQQCIREQNPERAARQFVDYWSGGGTWERLSLRQKAAVIDKVAKVAADFEATFGTRGLPSDFSQITCPTLLLYGLNSPSPTLRISEKLSQMIPDVEMRGLIGVGHMGPITHADQINRLILGFLESLDSGDETIEETIHAA